MNVLFSMSLAATAVEMAACLICARNLKNLQRESFDRSRRMLAMGALFCGLMALAIVLGNLGTATKDLPTYVLMPWIGLLYMGLNIVMVLYPISVVRPDWLRPSRFFFLFLPTLILAIVYLFFWNKWTLLSTYDEVWEHVWEPNVLARLASLFLMFPYCFILFMLPYNYHHSSADKGWIWNYSFGLVAICAVHTALMLTNNGILLVVLPIMVSTFYFFSTEYELRERLRPDSVEESSLERPSASSSTPLEQDLWARVCRLMDQEEVWKDPNLTLYEMSHLCATNATYLNRVIQMETNHGFKELLNSKRVAGVAAQIEQNPDIDVQSAFFNAGFRSRTTAWRNFKEITGKSPAEYKQAFKQ